MSVISDAGGEPRDVSGVYDGHDPAWSHDGRRLTFATDWNGGQGLVWVSARRPGRVYLEFQCGKELQCETIGSPTWSPDGTALAFASIPEPSESLLSVIVGESTTSSVAVRTFPLYTCCLVWWTSKPGQSAV